MAGPSKAWFELPESASLDIGRIETYLKRRTWTNYQDIGESFSGYHGIGLTSRSENPEHVNDALEVLQSVGTYESDESKSYNWQAIGVWNSNVEDYVKEVFQNLNLAPLRSRFSKLQPRTSIPPHVDDYSDRVTRLHWPIVTDEKNFFCFYDDQRVIEKVHMKVGRGYAVDTAHRHGFINFSKSVERIHFIVNVGMPFAEFSEWIKTNDLFKQEPIKK